MVNITINKNKAKYRGLNRSMLILTATGCTCPPRVETGSIDAIDRKAKKPLMIFSGFFGMGK